MDVKHAEHPEGWFSTGCPACETEFFRWLTRDRIRVPTGFPSFDRMTCGGLEPGTLVAMGGLTSTGKSLLGLNICEAARERGHGVAILSYEMPWTQWAQRLMAQLSRHGARVLEDGLEAAAHIGDLVESYERSFNDELAGRLFIRYSDKPGLDDLRRAFGEVAWYKPRVVLVDYVQLVRVEREKDGRPTEIERVIRELKALALEHECAVIAVAQLHRAAHDRPPNIGDFYFSATIEHAADLILLLDHTSIEKIRDEDTGRLIARIVPVHLKKSRLYGLLGGWKARIDTETLVMTELAAIEEEDPWQAKKKRSAS